MTAQPSAAALAPVAAIVAVLALGGATRAGAGTQATDTARADLARLDVLLASRDDAAAAALLASLAPEIAKDERLAFDTIYVLVRRGRQAEARTQWNRLAARLQDSLRADQPGAPGGAGAAGGPDPQTRRRLGEALFTQGLLLGMSGEKADALKLLGQADGYGFPPLDSPLMLLAAACLRDLHEYELAANAYRAVLERTPSDVDARVGLATVLYAARRFDEARTELEAVLQATPDTPRANYLLGAVLGEQNLHGDARVHLERELALDSRCVACLSRLAHLAYLDGDDRRCEALLARAAAIDPADVETDMVAGLLAFRQGDYGAAIDHLSRVVERSPDYTAARYQLAMAYRRAGNAEKAREHLAAYQQLLREQKARENGFRGQQ